MPHFENNNYVDAYLSLFDNMCNSFGFGAIPVSMDDFKWGNFMICLDLTKDFSCGSAHWTELGDGLVTLNLQFACPIPENVIVICFKEMDKICDFD